MSFSNIEIIISRIATATPEQPIAVFRCVGSLCKKNQLFASFGNTVITQAWIRNNQNKFLLLFDNTMNKDNVRAMLKEAVELNRREEFWTK